MVRSLILRIPGIRALVPTVTRPLLPLTRLTAASGSRIAVATRQGGRNTTRLFHHIPARLTSSRSPSPNPSHDLPPNATLSQRLKHLIKSYGWYALGVYILLSAADFTVAFAGVNILGAEYVSKIAASVKAVVVEYLPHKPAEPGREEIEPGSQVASGGHEGLWAMIVLAYTIHKTLFLPIRVGLTAAVTPRLVGWLRQRGWAGGAGTVRAAHEVREKIRNRRDRSRD